MSDKKMELSSEGENLSLKERVLYCIVGVFVFLPMLMVVKRLQLSERAELKKKLKHFNPTIRDTFWGKRVDWTGREKPLTNEQVEELLKT